MTQPFLTFASVKTAKFIIQAETECRQSGMIESSGIDDYLKLGSYVDIQDICAANTLNELEQILALKNPSESVSDSSESNI